MAPFHFSKHAMARMESRGIVFSGAEMGRLEAAFRDLTARGSRNALVLMPQAAMVVSVRSGTIVTVVATAGLERTVFTNIDSTVIA